MLSSLGLLCLSSTYTCMCVCVCVCVVHLFLSFSPSWSSIQSLFALTSVGRCGRLRFWSSTGSALLVFVWVVWRHGFERRLDWLTFNISTIWIIVQGFMRTHWASVERVEAEFVLVVVCVRGQAACKSGMMMLRIFAWYKLEFPLFDTKRVCLVFN